VIAIDNVLIDHYGKTIEDVGYFWDHVEERYKIAHDYVFANGRNRSCTPQLLALQALKTSWWVVKRMGFL